MIILPGDRVRYLGRNYRQDIIYEVEKVEQGGFCWLVHPFYPHPKMAFFINLKLVGESRWERILNGFR